MNSTTTPTTAEDAERLPESQESSSPEAISGRDESAAVSQPDQPVKKTVHSLTRNIEATDRLIQRTKDMVEAAKTKPDYLRTEETFPGLKRQLANLEQRKEVLERLRAKEIKYDDR
jgi:hypothetical protein